MGEGGDYYRLREYSARTSTSSNSPASTLVHVLLAKIGVLQAWEPWRTICEAPDRPLQTLGCANAAPLQYLQLLNKLLASEE